MTMRGRFFTRSEYMQHVYSALVNLPAKIKTLPPAIVKSKEGPLWSGKQVKKSEESKKSPFAFRNVQTTSKPGLPDGKIGSLPFLGLRQGGGYGSAIQGKEGIKF